MEVALAYCLLVFLAALVAVVTDVATALNLTVFLPADCPEGEGEEAQLDMFPR